MPQALHPLRQWAETHAVVHPTLVSPESFPRPAPTRPQIDAAVVPTKANLPLIVVDVAQPDPVVPDMLPEGEPLTAWQQACAWGSSLVVHAVVLLVCSLAYLAIEPEPEPPIVGTFVSNFDPQLTQVDLTQELDTSQVTADAPIALTTAKTVSEAVDNVQGRQERILLSELAVKEVPEQPLAFAPDDVAMNEVVEGIVGTVVNADGDIGAVDQITVEILRQLKDSKVLVVWLMDASESLQSRREQVIRRFERVYQELDELSESQPDALLTGVFSFGDAVTRMTEEPTSDREAILQAVRKIAIDESGVENVFTAIATAAGEYRPLAKKGYRVMLVVLTDEAGNDVQAVDEAVLQVKRNNVPVYVIGPLAPFSRSEVKVKWTDAETSESFFLPVERGPESVTAELASLPGWSAATRMGVLSSGFGPYGLTRIARESGGIYFLSDDGSIPGPTFDADVMRDHAPDAVSPIEYQKFAQSRPLRRAVLRVSDAVRQNTLPEPKTEFLAGGIQFEIREQHKALQHLYEFFKRAIDELQSVEKFREQEASARWQAHYDLLMGQLLLRRTLLANSLPLLGEMYQSPRMPSDVASNAWKLDGTSTSLAEGVAGAPDEAAATYEATSALEDTARAAAFLQRVVREHQGTPWAHLAQAELDTPLQFAWKETFVVPPEGEKLPWEKAPWKELTDEEKARLLAAKEKFERFRREQQKRQEQQQQREEVREQVKRRLPKL